MESCHKCRQREASYYCSICRRSYCDTCDLDIHSISAKYRHIRQKISSNYSRPSNNFYSPKREIEREEIYTGKNKLNYNYPSARERQIENENPKFSRIYPNNQFNNVRKEEPNLEKSTYLKSLQLSPNQDQNLDDTNQSIKRTKSFTYISDGCNKINFDEKMNLINKINKLNNELYNTKNNIGQRINILNSHINNIDETNANTIKILNNNNKQEIEKIKNQKDLQIAYLTEVIKDQENEINKLENQKNFLEKEIEENQLIAEKYEKEKNNEISEMDQIDEFYQEKIKTLTELFDKEKTVLLNDYQSQFEDNLLNCDENIKELNKTLTEKNEELKNCENIIENDLNELNSMINELQKQEVLLKNEQIDIIKQNEKINEELEKQKYNCYFEQTRANEVRNKLDINSKNAKDAQKQFEESRRKNEMIYRQVYGNFGRSKSKSKY